jgi:predicted protein tyrosine phosphatase
MTIFVCPRSRLEQMMALHRPERIVSVMDPGSAFPELGSAYADRHLRLSFHDVHEAAPNATAPSATHIRELLHFVRGWERRAPLLIHCRAGIGRSTATAYVAACFLSPSASEHDIAVVLRRASPLARPNETLVRVADREMRRNGRMSEAIASTGRGRPWIEVDEGEPFEVPLDFSSPPARSP